MFDRLGQTGTGASPSGATSAKCPIQPQDQELIDAVLCDDRRFAFWTCFSRAINPTWKRHGWWQPGLKCWVVPATTQALQALIQGLVQASTQDSAHRINVSRLRALINRAYKNRAENQHLIAEYMNARVFPCVEGGCLTGFDYDPIVIAALRSLKAHFVEEAGLWHTVAPVSEVLAAMARAGLPSSLVYVHPQAEPAQTIIDSIDVATTMDVGVIGPALRQLDRMVQYGDPAEVTALAYGDYHTITHDPMRAARAAATLSLAPHQVVAQTFLLRHNSGALADDMGLGKTRAAIATCKTLSDGGHIVIAPASALDDWQAEISQFYPKDRIVIQDADPATQRAPRDWTLASYAQLPRIAQAIDLRAQSPSPDQGYDHESDHKPGQEQGHESDLQPWSTIVFDEAINLKEQSSNRTLWAQQIARNLPHRYFLEGTPMLNREREIHSMLAVAGHPLGQIPRHEFERRFAGSRLLRQRLGHMLGDWMLRREKQDHLDLRPKQRYYKTLTLSAAQRAAYDLLADTPSPSMIAKAAYLRMFLEKEKIDWVVQRLLRLPADERAVVFCEYHSGIESAQQALDQAGLPYSVYTGRLSRTGRRRARQDFTPQGQARILLATRASAGKGPNLQIANNVFMAGLPWTGGDLRQAEDRAWRQGQQRDVRIWIPLIRGTFDEQNWALIGLKNTKSKDVEDAVKEAAEQAHDRQQLRQSANQSSNQSATTSGVAFS